MFKQATLFDSAECIFSAASAAGNTPCSSPAGPTSGPSGQVPAPASRSRRLANGKAKPTTATSGQRCSGSSASAALQSSLASRLRARMDCDGSMEYSLTWKEWATPAGRRICALRARVRRKSASGYFGWPAPTARDWRDGRSNQHGKNARPLNEVAMLALVGWPAPDASHHGSFLDPEKTLLRVMSHRSGGPKRSANLDDVVKLVGWAAPAANEPGGTPEQHLARKRAAVAARMWVTTLSHQALGISSGSFPVETTNSAGSVLNPAHSRWLQGFPETWDEASPSWDAWSDVQDQIASGGRKGMAMPSCPRWRQSSSGR